MTEDTSNHEFTAAPPGAAEPQKLRGALPSPRYMLASAPRFEPRGAPPANFLRLPRTLRMWLNDQYGNCVTASEAFAKATDGILIGDRVVYDFCRRYGLLNGAYLDQVLDLMRDHGFPQDGNTYRDGQKKVINWTDPVALRSAIAQATVKIGVAAEQLLRSHAGRNGWFALGYRRDPNLDHCVELPGYGTLAWLASKLGGTLPGGADPGAPGYALYTWSSVGVIDVPSMLAITGEAWIREPTTVAAGTGTPSPDVVDTYTDAPNPEPPPRPCDAPSPAPRPATARSCWLELLAAILAGVPLSEAAGGLLDCLLAEGQIDAALHSRLRRGVRPPAARGPERLGL